MNTNLPTTTGTKTSTKREARRTTKFLQTTLLSALFFLLLGVGESMGQVSTYSFTQSSGTYSSISSGTNYDNYTSWTNTNFLDDNNSSALESIGFNFVYNGTTYTQFGVNTNGFISLGSLPTNSYSPLSTGTSNIGISRIRAFVAQLYFPYF